MFRLTTSKFSLLMAVYFFTALNTSLLNRLMTIFSKTHGFSVLFYITIPVFFLAAFSIMFAPFVRKYFTKPFFITLILVSAFANYGSYHFGVVFDQDMIQNIYETTLPESKSYLNVTSVLWFIVTGIVPCVLICLIRIDYKPFIKEQISKIVFVLTCLAIIGIILFTYYKEYSSVARNNNTLLKYVIPSYPIASVYKFIDYQYFTVETPYQALAVDAKREKKDAKYLLIFVVGETARAQNYQWYGYKKKTNPFTSKIKNFFPLFNTSSCGTSTAVSLPCMFSLAGKEGYSQKRIDNQDNVLDILQRTGINLRWVDNNTGCKGVCDKIPTVETSDISRLHCVGEQCTDGVLLDVLDNNIQALDGRDGAVFLHLIGSHGPTYYQRYPRELAQFKPDCQTSDFQLCTKDNIVNSYDNTILFTDYVIAEVIKKLAYYNTQYHTMLVYVSDHGESLGEYGLYLHGMPYAMAPRYQTQVPFAVWFSDRTMAHKKIDPECLYKKAQKGGFSHDNIPSTLFNLLGVRTASYKNTLDVLSGCQDSDFRSDVSRESM